MVLAETVWETLKAGFTLSLFQVDRNFLSFRRSQERVTPPPLRD